MLKNKKKLLSVSAILSIILSMSIYNKAYAQISGYMVKDSAGNYYEYSADDLADSIVLDKTLFNNYIENLKKPSSKLYVKDDVKGYIDEDIIIEAIVLNGAVLNLDYFTENVDNSQVTEVSDESIKLVKVNEKGEIIMSSKQEEFDVKRIY